MLKMMTFMMMMTIRSSVSMDWGNYTCRTEKKTDLVYYQFLYKH